MNLEEENEEKRKEILLTREEWLTFFFFPFESQKGLDTNTFNKVEDQRFQEYGFNKKIKQSEEARIYGFAFYAVVFAIIFLIVIW
ncbi:hypothetical protein [Winogradskyella sp. R77965]|uniref:hypothetical protein n=1 Tax=Winogradskyella sp. R77965 TaxID=3093872 RepID=UPI0037DCA10B